MIKYTNYRTVGSYYLIVPFLAFFNSEVLFVNHQDGRIWKERASATVHRRGDLPVMKEGGALEPEGGGGSTRPRRSRSNRMILPSLSAPEHNLLKLLEESGI
jgi:hypothetical protein